MSDFKNILVAINPEENTHYALKRAIMLNEVTDGNVNIHLYIAMEAEKISQNNGISNNILDYKRLQGIIKPLEENNISHTTEIHWTDNWHRSVVDVANRHNAGLIIISDDTAEGKNTDLSASKWSLLRASNCPVLIVHPEVAAARKIILAAVNMQTDNPRYAKLNQDILKVAGALADDYGAEKHIINAYEDAMEFPDRAGLIRSTNAKQENIHVKQGTPTEIISEVANEINADIVVIGTLSRSGVIAAMRGNKSEKIIRDTNCDVMVLN